MVTSAKVDNGTVVLLNERGLSGTRLGNQYTAAGVCGEDLICVTKFGEVQHYLIEGERPSFVKSLGKSYDPISVQVGSGLNFSVTRSNGQIDYYANGIKTRTTGEEKIISTATDNSTSSYDGSDQMDYITPSYSVGDSGESSYSSSSGTDASEPDAESYVVVLSGMLAAFAFVVVTVYGKLSLGLLSAGVIFSIGYFLRYVLARCFRRSLYGVPACLALVIFSHDLAFVNQWFNLILAGILIWWLWPLVYVWKWFKE